MTQTIAAGGLRPSSGFAGDFTGNGFTDLVVGNTADGHLALLLGGAERPEPEPDDHQPGGARARPALSFAGVSDGVLSFYASTAGREAATALAFNLSSRGRPGRLGIGPRVRAGARPGAELAFGPVASAGSVLASATAGAFQQVAQLLAANGSTLSLVAPLFTVSVLPGEFEAGAAGEGGRGAAGQLPARHRPGCGGTRTAPRRRGYAGRCDR